MSSKKISKKINNYPFRDLGEELRTYRGRSKYKDFAALLGVHVQTYYRYETGERQVPAGVLKCAQELYNKDKASIPHVADPAAVYQMSTRAYTKPVDMLDAILGSGNQVFVHALMSNLIAFSEAVSTSKQQNQRIAHLESECDELRKRLAALEEKYKLIAPQPQPDKTAA